MWMRRRTVIGGQTAAGDYLVYRGRQVVGRVVPAPRITGGQPYQWSTKTDPPDRGRADSLEDALHQLREAVRARWPDDVAEVPRCGTKHSGDLPVDRAD